LNILDTPLTDLKIVQSTSHLDDRGAFMRLFCAQELQPVLGSRKIVQINHSRTSHSGAVRGMHFQRPPHAEMKMIRCMRGRVWDVAVDLRSNSPTFLRWHAVELRDGDAQMFVVPEGFAHGFQALEPDSALLYLHTEFYHPPAEGGLRHNDPRLDIPWPLPPCDISPRDRNHPLLQDDFVGF
jgi:dTDP-4-dehydrorhamnose 3,5-epimerase